MRVLVALLLFLNSGLVHAQGDAVPESEIVETKTCTASRLDALSFSDNMGLGSKTYSIDVLYATAYESCMKYFKKKYPSSGGSRIVFHCDPPHPYKVEKYCAEADVTGRGVLEPVCSVRCEFLKYTD